MVLTRSQYKLQLENESRSVNKLKSDIVSNSLDKEYIHNTKILVNDFEKAITIQGKMEIVKKITEYNIKMFPQFQPETLRHFTHLIKTFYKKCLEFEQQHTEGIYNKIQYKIVCDFIESVKKYKELIINDLKIQI